VARKPTFLVLVLAAAIPVLAIDGAMTHEAGVPIAVASECVDPASDADVEYAGDLDVWCGPNPSPTVTPPSSSSSPAPSGAPAPLPTPSPAPPQSSPAPLTSGPFPVGYFAPDFRGPATRQFSQQFITQIGTYVEVSYPAGSTSPSSGVSGGAQAQLPDSAGPVDDATLTYSVRFPVGFQWVKGGKLPGLCGGACWTGSSNGPGGWTTRFMWRSGGAGEVLLSDATTTGYGSDLGLGKWNFVADGRWHTIRQHVHLNTPGAADGFVDVTYDGVLVAHLTGITFRTSSATHVDSLMFSTFFGGHDSSWAPTALQRIDFATFRLTH
jgi:polysaccharide lyase-like protein